MTTPMGSSAGRHHGSGAEIGQDQERGAVHQGKRNDHPVAPAREQPDGVGNDDPDEGDQAADTDGGCRGQGRGENDQTAHPHHVDAEACSLFVAQAEHIEQATHEDKDGRGCQRVGDEGPNLAPADCHQSPQDPGIDLSQGLVVALEQERLNGGGEGGDGDTCQDQCRGGPATNRPTEYVCGPHRGDAAHEGHQGDGSRAGTKTDHGSCSETGPGGHSEQIGIGERIPEHTLVPRTGYGQDRPDQAADHDTRHSQLEEEPGLDLAQPVLHGHERESIGKRLDHLHWRHGHRTDQQPGQGHDEQDGRRHQPPPGANSRRSDGRRGRHLAQEAGTSPVTDSAINSSNSTTRGPQFEARYASKGTIASFWTAVISAHPGRSLRLSGVTPKSTSAR